MRLFYEQAAATCHFLYNADSGKQRGALLEFVRSYYTADEKGMNVANRLGMTPEELGAAVVQYAQEVTGR